MDARHILNLLALKHAGETFIPECKDGATQIRAHRRLDAWVLRNTWVPWTTVGYEVKVDRQDFENDQKWFDYRGLAHEFYLVCPSKLVTVPDLPDNVGLIWATKSRLVMKRKSPREAPDPARLLQLMSYVLMHRMVLSVTPLEGKLDRMAQTRRFVEESEARKELAYIVNKHVRDRHREMAARVESAERAEREVTAFVLALAAVGIDYTPGRGLTWKAMGQARELVGAVDNGLVRSLRESRQRIDRLISAIEAEAERLRPQVEGGQG